MRVKVEDMRPCKLANANQSIGITRIASRSRFRDPPVMDWKDKLRQEIQSRGLEMKAISIAAGLGETYLFDVLKRNRSSQRPNLVAMRKIAIALGRSPDWLFTSQEPEKIRVALAPVKGIAQAGVWREHDDLVDDGDDPVPVVPGKWSRLEQFAFRIAGASMDKAGITDGTYVICVPYFMARTALTDNDIVVVERRRAQTTERTVKRLRVSSERLELWPESSDPRFQLPVLAIPNGGIHDEDGTEVEVVGLVIGRYASM